MPKDDIRGEWPKGNLVCWAPEYSGRDLPSDERTHSVVVGLHHCQVEPPDPEYVDGCRNMTGRYQAKRSVCCVNQAGTHMELWYSASTGSRKVYHYWADQLDVPGLFEIREVGDPTVFYDIELAPGAPRRAGVGWLAIVRDGEFRIDWADGTGGSYKRFSSRATLSERAVEAMQQRAAGDHVVQGWLAAEHAPLRDADIDDIVEHFTSHGFRELLQAIMGLEVDSGNLNRDAVQVNMEALAKDLNQLFEMIPGSAGQSDRFADSDRGRVAARLWPELVAQTMKLRTPSGDLEHRSVFEWLQRVVYYNRNYGPPGGAKIEVITKWIGIPYPGEERYEIYGAFEALGLDAALPFAKVLEKLGPKVKKVVGKALSKIVDKITKFRWDWGQSIDKKKIEKYLFEKAAKKLEKLLMAHAGGKVLLGVMTVKSPNGGWEHPFEVVALLGSAGLGGASQGVDPFVCSGYALAGFDWKPEAFCGDFTVLGTEQSRDQFGTKKDKQMIWLLRGSGAAGVLQLVWDHVETKTSSIDLGWGRGQIFDFEDDGRETPVPSAPVFEYTSELEREQDVHFWLGSATVRPVARQVLRIFAANELALLRDPLCSLVVLGYADRVGGRNFNRVLSESRATNVLQALENALGDDLRAEVLSLGMGEDVIAALGEALGFPDGKPNEQWRRGFVVLEGVVAAAMGTSDGKQLRRK